MLSESPYVFSRIDARTADHVVVALNVQGDVTLPVGSAFTDGQWLHDAYSGQRVVVAGGKVALKAAGTVLLERSAPPAGR